MMFGHRKAQKQRTDLTSVPCSTVLLAVEPLLIAALLELLQIVLTWIWGVTVCFVDALLYASGAEAQTKLGKSFFRGGVWYVLFWSFDQLNKTNPFIQTAGRVLRGRQPGRLHCFSFGSSWEVGASVEQKSPVGSCTGLIHLFSVEQLLPT